MKPKNSYCKITICGVPYLLPYGQEIAAHAPNLRLNSSAEFLWDALLSGASTDELPSLLMEKYDRPKEELPLLCQDVERFLNILKTRKILLPETAESIPKHYPLRYLQIASLTLAFYGPDSLYNTYFSDFSSNTEAIPADGEICLLPYAPARRSCGKILIRNEELIIADDEAHYYFYFSDQYAIHEMRVAKDGRQTQLFFDSNSASEENLFHAMRFAFLILAQQHNLYAVHSASLLYRNKAWLFSGPSGTGKSTHAALWKNEFETPLLNGDLNILGLNNGVPTVFGLPWCGTSGIFSNARHPLGGVIFLAQASHNKVCTLSPHEQTLSLAQRMISPTWTQKLLTQNLTFAENLSSRIFIARLLCTPEPNAAIVMKQAIDEFLARNQI